MGTFKTIINGKLTTSLLDHKVGQFAGIAQKSSDQYADIYQNGRMSLFLNEQDE